MQPSAAGPRYSHSTQSTANRSAESRAHSIRSLLARTLDLPDFKNPALDRHDNSTNLKWCAFCFLSRRLSRNHYTDSCPHETKNACVKCLSPEHFKASCPVNQRENRGRKLCFACGLHYDNKTIHPEEPGQACLVEIGRRKSAVQTLAWAWARKQRRTFEQTFQSFDSDELSRLEDPAWSRKLRTWLDCPAFDDRVPGGVTKLELVFIFAYYSTARCLGPIDRKLLAEQCGLKF